MYRTCAIHHPTPCVVVDELAQEGYHHKRRAIHDSDLYEESHETDQGPEADHP